MLYGFGSHGMKITTFHNYLGDFIQACSTHQTVANPGFWVLQRPRKFCGMSMGSDPKVNAHMFKIPHEKFRDSSYFMY